MNGYLMACKSLLEKNDSINQKIFVVTRDSNLNELIDACLINGFKVII
jgi:hypothetical protein